MYICIARIRKTPLTHCQRNANNRQTGGFSEFVETALAHYLATSRESVVVAVVYLHDITTYINIREISQMNHANKDLKEVKNL